MKKKKKLNKCVLPVSHIESLIYNFVKPEREGEC